METAYENKPYVFVPLARDIVRKHEPNRQNLLTAGYMTGKLAVRIECVTPLHFGSGQLEFQETSNRFLHTLLREDGEIALPGSSFKGMLRTVFEAVSPSCVLNSPRALPLKVGKLSSCSRMAGVCPACSVFGKLSYKGKVRISSFRTAAEPVTIKLPSLERPFKKYKAQEGNERLYYGNFSDVHGLDVARMTKADYWKKKDREPQSGGNFYGRKFYLHSNQWRNLSEHAGWDNYECLPEQTVLSGDILYQGLAEDELGALLFALGLGWERPIYHKLGYAKPAFLGSVKLSVTPAALPRYDEEPMSAADAERLAIRYYGDQDPSIKSAVAALGEAWGEIGNRMWPMADGKYGY